jgi:hypothetical protein
VDSGELKQCARCALLKPLAAFSHNRRAPDGLDSQCRACTAERMRLKKRRHVEAGLCQDCGTPRDPTRSAKQCAVCLRKQAIRTTQRNKANRLGLIYHYGGEATRCACCGEGGIAFLTLDHVAKNGGEHRRRLTGHQGTYRQLIADGYPSGIQVLCYNCNMARGLYGACPHRRDDGAEHVVPLR